MAEAGDAASAAGYPIVPDTGEEGRVRWGAREINRTRDFIANLAILVPTNKASARDKAGLKSGSAEPIAADGDNGDVYFKVV